MIIAYSNNSILEKCNDETFLMPHSQGEYFYSIKTYW